MELTIGATDIGAAVRDDIRDGGTLRWPLPELPGQWNFHQVNGMSGAADKVLRAVLPYPMKADAQGDVQPDPDYFASAEVVARSPRQVVRYRVNPLARWSDGRPIGYRDFAAQAYALSGRAKGFLVASDSGYKQIAEVERGSSIREVFVTFAQPYADWKSLFTPLYPAQLNEKPRVFNEGWVGRIPVTAGPFRVAGLDAVRKTVTVARDPGWWGRPAKLDAITFRALDATAAAGAFANGEIDLLDVGTDAAAHARALTVRDAALRRAAGPDWRHLTLNGAAGPLADVRVRRAVQLGIDRAALARAALGALPWPVRTLDHHLLMDGQPGYRAALVPAPAPGEAARLLDAAGWRLTGSRRTRDGRPLALRFVFAAGVAAAKDEAELVQAMLARLGVRVDLVAVPQPTMIPDHVAPGRFDLTAFSWLGGPFPASSAQPVFTRRGGLNFARTGTPAIDALLTRAAEDLDPASSRALLNQADALLWQQAPVIPLYRRPQLVAVTARLANLGAQGLQNPAYPDIGFTRP